MLSLRADQYWFTACSMRRSRGPWTRALTVSKYRALRTETKPQFPDRQDIDSILIERLWSRAASEEDRAIHPARRGPAGRNGSQAARSRDLALQCDDVRMIDLLHLKHRSKLTRDNRLMIPPTTLRSSVISDGRGCADGSE